MPQSPLVRRAAVLAGVIVVDLPATGREADQPGASQPIVVNQLPLL